MDHWLQSLAQWMGVETETAGKLVWSLGVLVQVVRRRVTRPTLQYRLNRVINYSASCASRRVNI